MSFTLRGRPTGMRVRPTDAVAGLPEIRVWDSVADGSRVIRAAAIEGMPLPAESSNIYRSSILHALEGSVFPLKRSSDIPERQPIIFHRLPLDAQRPERRLVVRRCRRGSRTREAVGLANGRVTPRPSSTRFLTPLTIQRERALDLRAMAARRARLGTPPTQDLRGRAR